MPATVRSAAPPACRREQHDELESYLRAAKRYPLLDRDEETELASRWHHDHDRDAMQRLVACNLRLVVKVANRYRKSGWNVLDLIQEGNIGLLHAVRKFDPHRGAKLSTYAMWWIRAYVLRYVLENFRLVKIGTTNAQRRLFFNLRKEQARLRAAGIEPDAERLAENLQVGAAEVREMDTHLSAADESLEAPIATHDAGSQTRCDLLADDTVDIESEAVSTEFSHVLADKLRAYEATLSGRDLEVFRERWLSDQPLTFSEFGERWGLSRERARQLELRMRKPLRQFLQREMGDSLAH